MRKPHWRSTTFESSFPRSISSLSIRLEIESSVLKMYQAMAPATITKTISISMCATSHLCTTPWRRYRSGACNNVIQANDLIILYHILYKKSILFPFAKVSIFYEKDFLLRRSQDLFDSYIKTSFFCCMGFVRCLSFGALQLGK